MKAPVDGKFVAYGGPAMLLDTELRGQALNTDPGMLFITPDQNYMHLCGIGNTIIPGPGEPVSPGSIQAVISQAAGRPVIKCELYGVGSRPDPSQGNPGTLMVVDGGRQRPLAIGDHIRIRGLYVFDYAHPWSNGLWTSSFVVMRGLLEAGYVHSELHPYDFQQLALISELSHSDQLSEGHTFVAPICPEQYSSTYAWNKVNGVAGDLVDNAMWTSLTSRFTVHGDPAPDASSVRRLRTANEVIIGNPPTLSYSESGGTDLEVTVTMTGTDVANPSIYTATFSVEWSHALSKIYCVPATVPVDTPVSLEFRVVDAQGSAVPDCNIYLNNQLAGTSGTSLPKRTFQHIMVRKTERETGTNGKPVIIRYQAPAPPTVTVHATKAGYDDAWSHLVFGPVAGADGP